MSKTTDAILLTVHANGEPITRKAMTTTNAKGKDITPAHPTVEGLVKSGLLAHAGTTPPAGRGRPSTLYTLTEAGIAAVSALTGEVIEPAVEVQESTEPETTIDDIAAQIEACYQEAEAAKKAAIAADLDTLHDFPLAG